MGNFIKVVEGALYWSGGGGVNLSGYGNLREFRLRSQEEDVNKAFLEGMVFTGESEAIAKINDINPRETRLNNALCVIF